MKKEILETRMFQESTLLLYESPYRVKETLEAIHAIDSERRVTLGRELTKKFEQITTDRVEHLLSQLEKTIPLKGEFVIVIEGAEAVAETQWFEELSIDEHVEHYIAQNMKPKQAIKQVAQEREISSKTVYNIYHKIEA